MNDPAISAHASPSDAIVADQAAAFEDFFRGQTQNLYAHLCLITGNRAEGRTRAGRVPEGLGAMGPGGRHGGPGRLPLQDSHEPVPQAVPQGCGRAPQDGVGGDAPLVSGDVPVPSEPPSWPGEAVENLVEDFRQGISFDVHEFADLDDGRRLTLHEERAGSGSPGSCTSMASRQQPTNSAERWLGLRTTSGPRSCGLALVTRRTGSPRGEPAV